MTPSGIELATSVFVAQYLKELSHLTYFNFHLPTDCTVFHVSSVKSVNFPLILFADQECRMGT